MERDKMFPVYFKDWDYYGDVVSDYVYDDEDGKTKRVRIPKDEYLKKHIISKGYEEIKEYFEAYLERNAYKITDKAKNMISLLLDKKEFLEKCIVADANTYSYCEMHIMPNSVTIGDKEYRERATTFEGKIDYYNEFAQTIGITTSDATDEEREEAYLESLRINDNKRYLELQLRKQEILEEEKLKSKS
jgi:hypothetical protein